MGLAVAPTDPGKVMLSERASVAGWGQQDGVGGR